MCDVCVCVAHPKGNGDSVIASHEGNSQDQSHKDTD